MCRNTSTHDFYFSAAGCCLLCETDSLALPLRVRHPRRTPALSAARPGSPPRRRGSACEKLSSMRPVFAGGTATTWSCCFALFCAAALLPGRAGSFQLVPSPFPRHASGGSSRLAGPSACRVGGRKCSAVQMMAGGSKGDHDISESGTKLNKGKLKKQRNSDWEASTSTATEHYLRVRARGIMKSASMIYLVPG